MSKHSMRTGSDSRLSASRSSSRASTRRSAAAPHGHVRPAPLGVLARELLQPPLLAARRHPHLPRAAATSTGHSSSAPIVPQPVGRRAGRIADACQQYSTMNASRTRHGQRRPAFSRWKLSGRSSCRHRWERAGRPRGRPRPRCRSRRWCRPRARPPGARPGAGPKPVAVAAPPRIARPLLRRASSARGRAGSAPSRPRGTRSRRR